jgi:hypothetical protein
VAQSGDNIRKDTLWFIFDLQGIRVALGKRNQLKLIYRTLCSCKWNGSQRLDLGALLEGYHGGTGPVDDVVFEDFAVVEARQ